MAKVKAQGSADNPYAVCAKSTGYVRKKGGGWTKKKVRKGGGKK